MSSTLGNCVTGFVYAPYIPVMHISTFKDVEIEPLEMMLLMDMFGFKQTEKIKLMYRLPAEPGILEFNLIMLESIPMPHIDGCIEYNVYCDKFSSAIKHRFKITEFAYNKLIKEYERKYE